MSKKTITEVIKFIGAVEDEWQLYSDNPSDYTIGRPIGFGASSVVYQAEYHPATGERIQCALKVLDLDSLSSGALRLLQRETQLMSLSKHPNVLRVRGSLMDGHKLYIAMRLMRSGSVADVIRYKWADGVEEEVAKCILKQALQGLNYLHVNKFIHRDIKAANLLIDDDGTVLLGDLGVAVALNEEEHTLSTSGKITWKNNTYAKTQGDGSPPLRKRKSFVGTPCWMAPEVISQRSYDSKADIWSLGITALELAQGRPPRSRESPQRALLKTVQEEPPSLDRRSARFKYSKAFDEFVQRCLQKNPNQRPTAAELLQLPYFKTAKKKSFLVGALLSGLPPLVDRQERKRINTSVSRISVDSWDFSSTGPLSSPPSSIRMRPSTEIGILDIDGLPAKESSGKDAEITEHILPCTQPDLSPTLEEEEFAQGSSEGSIPGTSPATSYQSPSTMEKPPPTSRRASANSGVSTSSPRLWQKLKELGSKVTDRGR